MGIWRPDPNAYKAWSTYKPEGSTPKKAAAKAVAIAKRPDRYDYALRMFGRAAARRPLKANATDAEKLEHLLQRTREDDQLAGREAQRRSRELAQRTTALASRAMLRGGGSINSAQDAIRSAFSSGW